MGVAVRRHRPDYQIILYMALLMLLGLITMYAIGPQRAHILNLGGGSNISDSYFFIKQAIALGLSLVGFAIMAYLPYRWLQQNALRLLLVGLGLCVVLWLAHVFHMPFAPSVNGAVRWFNLGPLGSVQPAEFLKFSVVVFVAGLLAARYREEKVNDYETTLVPVGALLVLLMVFVVILQKNMSTGIIIALIIMGMLFAAGLSRKIITLVAIIGLVGGIGLILIAPHRMARVATFLQGDSLASFAAGDDQDLQARQARIAIGSGGIMGVGIGNSVQATGYLPESTNDSIFAIMGETFGFVGLVVILAIFTGLLLRLLRVADHLPQMWMKLATVGIFAWLVAHVFINVASMVGVIPLTGVTLPLVSFGGTSMVFIAGALGLVFQLSRYTVNTVNVEGEQYESTDSGRRLGRTRYARGSSAIGTR